MPIGKILQAGRLVNSTGVSFTRMRVLGSFALIFLTRGNGHYQLRGGDPLPCQPGDVLVVFPEIAHAYGPRTRGRWDELYLVFDGPVFNLWRESGWLVPQRPILSPRPMDLFRESFRKIVDSDTDGMPAREQQRICDLQTWMAEALPTDTRYGTDDFWGNWPDWMSTAARFMRDHPSASVQETADMCKLSQESFRKKFRDLAGVSPGRYRDLLMVSEAKKLIYEERLGNKQIALRLGICDEFHFSKRFHQIAGVTPSAFRRSLVP